MVLTALFVEIIQASMSKSRTSVRSAVQEGSDNSETNKPKKAYSRTYSCVIILTCDQRCVLVFDSIKNALQRKAGTLWKNARADFVGHDQKQTNIAGHIRWEG